MANDQSTDSGDNSGGSSGLSRFVTARVRYWITLSGIVIPALLVVIFVVLWFVRRDRIPAEVRLATALPGSSYHVFGTEFCKVYNRRLGAESAGVVETSGSGTNVRLLRDHEAELSMYQAGSVGLDGVVVVAPLYREVVHVLVRKRVLDNAKYRGRDLCGELLRDLLLADGREIYAGSANSGMRYSARQILEHYGIDLTKVRFADKEARSTAVVISTTGMFSKAMQNRLRGGDYDYLSINADAIADRHVHFATHTIHQASYRNAAGQPVPNRDVRTVAAIAMLIVRGDASPRMVEAALDALYQGDLGRKHPDLIPRDQANGYLHGIPVHETAREFFEPYDVAYLVNVIQSLAATKELLVAIGAGLYLLWTLRHRQKQRRRCAEMVASRVHLDRFVSRTVTIESAQMGVTDPDRLARYLEEVTRIKLKALEELTDAELRGDRAFSIFLMQCANLINTLQLKIIT